MLVLVEHKAKCDTGAAGPHIQNLFAHFFLCQCVCVSVSVTVSHAEINCRHVVSTAIFPFSQRDTLQGGGGPGLTLCDKSFSHSQPYCLRGSPSPSIPLSLLFMPLRVSGPLSTAASASLSSSPFHLYSILRAAHLSFVVHSRPPFLISLYLPPSSCSSFSETMLLRGCRGTRAKATMIILLHCRKSTHGKVKGREERLVGERAVLIHLAGSLTK